MKRKLFVFIFSLFALSIAATAQEPAYMINGESVTIEQVIDLSSDSIEMIEVVKNAQALDDFEKRYGFRPACITKITAKSVDGEDEVFLMVDEMPQFMGGDLTTFRNWVMQNVRYPEEAMNKGIEGMVLVRFCVSKDGYINESMTGILESPDKSLSDEVLRVLKSSPQWIPGKQKGKNVIVQFVLPVNFKFANSANITSDDDQSANGIEQIEVVSFGE
ncbi:MAG: energy transducer TonB [Alistipes sp.]|nr:energy transducer TonB [Alistipes sp.]